MEDGEKESHELPAAELGPGIDKREEVEKPVLSSARGRTEKGGGPMEGVGRGATLTLPTPATWVSILNWPQ